MGDDPPPLLRAPLGMTLMGMVGGRPLARSLPANPLLGGSDIAAISRPASTGGGFKHRKCLTGRPHFPNITGRWIGEPDTVRS